MQEPISFPEEYLSDYITDTAWVNHLFQRLRLPELVIDDDSYYYDKN